MQFSLLFPRRSHIGFGRNVVHTPSAVQYMIHIEKIYAMRSFKCYNKGNSYLNHYLIHTYHFRVEVLGSCDLRKKYKTK